MAIANAVFWSLLGADGDFGSAKEHAASNCEPAYAPEDFETPQQQPLSLGAAAEAAAQAAAAASSSSSSSNLGTTPAPAAAPAAASRDFPTVFMTTAIPAGLTKLNLQDNNMGAAWKQAVRDAVKDRSGFKLYL